MLELQQSRPSTAAAQEKRNRRGNFVVLALAVMLIAAGALMPTGWYDALPLHPESTAATLKGVTLLQGCLIAEGIALLLVALGKWNYKRLSPGELPPAPSPLQKQRTSFDISVPIAMCGLIAITALAAILRIYKINTGLWLDEISPLEFYRHTSIFHLFTVYYSTNNHLLNTVLTKLATSAWGEEAWAVRLPAVTFGVLTIPLSYALARTAFSRKSSLAVAFLLAVSYHHIFFSQNARGYSSFLFFSMASSLFLVRGVSEDRKSDWTFYVLSVVGSIAALLQSFTALTAHIIICAVVVANLARQGKHWTPLAKRLVAVMVGTTLISIQLFSVIIPQALSVLHGNYQSASSGYAPLSMEFVNEVLKGLAAGAGPVVTVAAIPAACLFLFGCVSLFRRNWIMTLTMVMPEIVLAVFLLIKHYTVEPRFFLLALPFAMLVAVAAIEDLTLIFTSLTRLPARAADGLAALAVVALVAISATMLPRYYQTPKQDYAKAIDYANSLRKPGSVLVPLYLAKEGFDFYGPRLGLKEGSDFYNVRTDDQWSRALAGRKPDQVIMVTTFKRALHLDLPLLEERLQNGWLVAKVFPGTIGDGDITVWKGK